MKLQHLLSVVALTISAAKGQSATAGLTTWEQIHQTLNTYPLAVDFKNAALFPHVFAPNAVANYTGALSNMTGIEAITQGLLASVSSLITQHQLGTTTIDISVPGAKGGDPDDKTGRTANATTYFTAALFSSAPETPGAYTILFGLYSDELVETDVTDGPSPWRIVKRQLVFMTPTLGNLTLG